MVYFLQASSVPQLHDRSLRVLQALFNLNAFLCSDGLSEHHDVPQWRVEGLMTTPVSIVDILADHLPILEFESLFSKNFVCMNQAIEDEPVIQVSVDLPACHA